VAPTSRRPVCSGELNQHPRSPLARATLQLTPPTHTQTRPAPLPVPLLAACPGSVPEPSAELAGLQVRTLPVLVARLPPNGLLATVLLIHEDLLPLFPCHTPPPPPLCGAERPRRECVKGPGAVPPSGVIGESIVYPRRGHRVLDKSPGCFQGMQCVLSQRRPVSISTRTHPPHFASSKRSCRAQVSSRLSWAHVSSRLSWAHVLRAPLPSLALPRPPRPVVLPSPAPPPP
jgi:hypothetical protein